MKYAKRFAAVNKTSKRAVIADFSGGVNTSADDSVLPLRFARRSFNFDAKSGALKDGAGLAAFEKGAQKILPKLPQNTSVLRCYFYKRFDFEEKKDDDRVIIYCADNKMYGLNLYGAQTEFEEIEHLGFQTPPDAANYRYNDEDCIIFSSKGEGIKIYFGYGYPLEAANAPEISSMCLHYERLFAVSGEDKTRLWFSDDLDPANWYVSLDEAGYIDMPDERGALLCAVSFLDYLYVFRSYGISRITAYGDQTEFSAVSLFVSSGKILKDSVTVCGDRIIFLAADGLYRFDGISTKRILEGYDGIICKRKITAAKGEYLNGVFYLMLDVLDENQTKRALLCYDIAQNSSYMSLLPISDMVKITADSFSQLLFLTQNGELAQLSDIAEVMGRPLEKVWQSAYTDLGDNRPKLIRQMSVTLDGSARITVCNKTQKKHFTVSGSGQHDIKINLKGQAFSFMFTSTVADTKVARPQVLYDIM